jgi:2-polyprenyl-3-methyl-5-hydroxy-6-metoxy-1,4-benzoquinol methylase
MSDFDAEAKEWDAVPGRIERANTVAAAIREQLPLSRQMKALEYGCGTGLLSFALHSDLGPITLADSSTGMLDVLRAKIACSGVRNMTPRRLDLSMDPLPIEKYHLIYTLMTLHHIPEAYEILRSFYAMLEPSGCVCIVDLDKEDGSFHGADFVGHQGFDRAELCQRLSDIGYVNIRINTCYEIPKNERNYPLFLAVGEKI